MDVSFPMKSSANESQWKKLYEITRLTLEKNQKDLDYKFSLEIFLIKETYSSLVRLWHHPWVSHA